MRLRSRRSLAISATAPLGLIAIAVAIGSAATPSLQGTVTAILCNLIVVCGLQVFIGNSGVYSFGQIGFAAIGAYLAALLTLPAAFAALQTPGLPQLIATAQPGPLLATLLAAGFCALAAALVGLPLMRTSTLAIPISTFAFLIVVYNVLANWDRVTGGASGLVSIPRTTTVTEAGLWAAAATLIALAFKISANGYRLRASRESEVAARSIGVRVMRERLIAFAISAALCGAGGALAVHQSGVLNPTTFYFGATVTTLTMLVVGGTRSVLGAVVGTLAVSGVNEVLRGLEGGFHVFDLVSIDAAPGLAAIGLGLILLGTMVAMPSGLSGGREAGELARGRRRRAGASPTEPAARKPSATESRPGFLEAQGVTVSFGGLQVLRGVDLKLEAGEALGLIGPNGAGKTTLLNVLSGFQQLDDGTVRIDGVDVHGLAPESLARNGLARSFQAALPFSQLGVLESVAVGALGVGVGRGEATAIATGVLQRLGLLEQAERASGSLPLAGQRLLGVARALATEPRYLLLDEPAAGLDEAESEELVAALARMRADFGCGILLVEHDIGVISGLCSRAQVLDDGATVALGTPQEVQSDPVVISSYLGSSFAGSADA